jgi:hypothetical protein
MKKLLIPLLILLSLSACDFPDFRGDPITPNLKYRFNGYITVNNPASSYGDTILVYPDFELILNDFPFQPKDSLYDIFVDFDSNIKVHNISTSRDASVNSAFILGDTLMCSIMHSKSGRIQFIVDDPDDYVFRQSFPVLTLSIKE